MLLNLTIKDAKNPGGVNRSLSYARDDKHKIPVTVPKMTNTRKRFDIFLRIVYSGDLTEKQEKGDDFHFLVVPFF